MQVQVSPCLVIVDLLQIAKIRPRDLARLRRILRPHETFVYSFIYGSFLSPKCIPY
jgi:hypothetical protein